MQSYFDNLTLNFGKNYAGSCGYVAIELLLSYYDTYLNDAIVPAQYEANSHGVSKNLAHRRNSPGSLRDVDSNPNSLTVQNYISDHVNLYESTSLHAKLISIGNSLGYVNANATSLETMCTTTASQRSNIISAFLTGVSGLSSNDFDIHITPSYGGNMPGHVSDIQTIIGNGQPAIVSIGQSSSGSGHACVAYDYDSTGLFFHYGHGSDKTHSRLDAGGYSFVRGEALWIEFHLSHVHTNNYSHGPSYANQTAVCWDDNDVAALSTDHDYFYQQVNATSHTASCDCGNTYNSLHVVPTGTSYHFGRPRYADCIYCGWSVDLLTGIYLVDGDNGNLFANGELISDENFRAEYPEIAGVIHE